MIIRKEAAAFKKQSGQCNCAQAVISTYADLAGIDENLAMQLGNAFAAGMGNTEGTCGALVGAGIILGLVNQNKIKSTKGMHQIMEKFQKRNGATQCKLLKGMENGVVLRSCPDCVADAAEFLEEAIVAKE